MIYIAVGIDVIHALLMLLWVVGLPFLFWQRFWQLHRKLALAYCWFALAFVVVNQLSHYILGVCVLTTLAGYFYSHTSVGAPSEWFTVYASKAVFGMAPTHRAVKVITSILVGVCAIGGIYAIGKLHERKTVL